MQNENQSDPGHSSEDRVNESLKCPVCHSMGQGVGRSAVEHLVKDEDRLQAADDEYRICLDESCGVVYYSLEKGIIFTKDQVRVPIWFKEGAYPRYACYCSQVTEDQVIDAVIRQGARTVRDVNRLTGAMKNSNCKEKNPLGICCHGIIQAAIEKALKGN